MIKPCILATAAALTLLVGNVWAQHATPTSGDTTNAHTRAAHPHPDHLLLGGLLPETRLDRAALQAMPRSQIQASDHGTPALWEGVELVTLLRETSAELGTAHGGAQLARHVLVEVADGYRVLFSMGELDPAFGGAKVLLADTRDGQPLDATIGPWRMVVPGDQRQGRWVRNVVSIRLLQAAPME